MSKINLLPKEEFDRKSYGKFLKWVLTYGRYIIISVELVVFLVFFSRFVYDQQLAELNDSVEQKQSIVASARKLETRILSIQDQLSKIKNLETGRLQYINILSKLEIITPKEVMFSKIILDNDTITLSGEALSNESFAQFINTLTNDPQFDELTINNLEKDDDTNTFVFTATATMLVTPQTLKNE